MGWVMGVLVRSAIDMADATTPAKGRPQPFRETAPR
jgi:hypothetical protein